MITLRLQRISNFLVKLPFSYFAGIGVLVSFCIALFSSFISNFIFNKSLASGGPDIEGDFFSFIIAVVVAPLLETSIFQYGIIEWAKKRTTYLKAAILSAIIFGLSHSYNPFYIGFALLFGLWMAYIYYVGSFTRLGGFLTVLIIHSLYNLLVFFLHRLE